MRFDNSNKSLNNNQSSFKNDQSHKLVDAPSLENRASLEVSEAVNCTHQPAKIHRPAKKEIKRCRTTFTQSQVDLLENGKRSLLHDLRNFLLELEFFRLLDFGFIFFL